MKKVGRIVVLSVVLVLMGTWAYAADCNNGGRYEDNIVDGTVTDCRTGMIWLKNTMCTGTSGGIPNATGYLTWYDAMKWVAGLHDGLCGLSDGSYQGFWRLPTKTEWLAMVEYSKWHWLNPALSNGTGDTQWSGGDVFISVQSDFYWSSTTTAISAGNAWVIDLADGLAHEYLKSYVAAVWPVRGGQSGTFGTLFIE